MVIPGVAQIKIAEAIKTFDRNYRNTPAFTGWEHKGTQRYAIVLYAYGAESICD